ncbi:MULTISPECIES: hypothetical protein [unclassified Salinibacterium]|nr:MULTISPECIES: hypothetical protein [unclassified Salinibacterium]
MSELTRQDIAPTRTEIRADTRREFRLLLKAAVGFLAIAGVIWLRVEFFE